MVTGDPVDLDLTMSPSSRKIPALLTKESAQPCQTERYGEIRWIRVRPTDDDDDDDGDSYMGDSHMGILLAHALSKELIPLLRLYM